MKQLIILSVFLTFSTLASAQFFELGARGGANFHNVKIKDIDEKFSSFEKVGKPGGFHLGAYGRFNFTGLYLQPELLYTFQSGDFVYERKDGGGVQNLSLKVSRFDIPLLFGAKLGPVLIGAGPVASFAIGTAGEAFEKNFRDASYGYQLGLGINLGKKLRLETRYEGALGKMAESVKIDGEDYHTDMRISQFIVGIGFNFL